MIFEILEIFEILVIFAGVNGYLDQLPLSKLGSYETQLLDYLTKNHPAIAKTITEKKTIDDETKSKLAEALKAFEKVFS